ncbi:hypothetical protein GRX03_04845 [Halovenus sp. WSH3]|uniref:Uncharacterized protein n=1 Tax=Halovenus carboxidivorans TaxID=2692199 RepID=A0A6B0T440_9EURY|nr:hypothetical protein [Halovenus carboxidivorans]MXR50936.1 hypothetical protein [Halovenus carboxidivorans]
MDQCPHCGSRIDDGVKCPNCGQSLDSLPEYSEATTDRPAVQQSRPPTEVDSTVAPIGGVEPTDGPGSREDADRDAADQQADRDAESAGLGTSISRRALLGGAGASVALLGVGGASWLYLRGGGAGDDIVRSYVDAMATNNWSQIERLYHEDSPVITQIEESQEFDDYEGFLESREVLETWERLEPELDGIQEFYHATEVTEQSAKEINVQIKADAVEMIDEVRSVIAFVSVEVGAIDEGREDAAQYYQDGRLNRPLTHNLVSIDGQWHLWTVRGIGRFRRRGS